MCTSELCKEGIASNSLMQCPLEQHHVIGTAQTGPTQDIVSICVHPILQNMLVFFVIEIFQKKLSEMKYFK